jgi:hypothetical protein
MWFAVEVPLGEKTLWQHARAIAGSRESKELADEVKRKASRAAARPDAGSARQTPAREPEADRLSAEERRLLRKLIREKLAAGRDD